MDTAIGMGRRFSELHSRFMPRTYRMAVWLLRDAAKAEAAAGSAFVRAVERADTPDAREFSVSCTRLLLEECAHAGMPRREPESVCTAGQEELLTRLGGLDRCIVTLAVCGRFSVPEIALILRRSERRVEMCIKSAAKQMRVENRSYSAVTAS